MYDMLMSFCQHVAHLCDNFKSSIWISVQLDTLSQGQNLLLNYWEWDISVFIPYSIVQHCSGIWDEHKKHPITWVFTGPPAPDLNIRLSGWTMTLIEENIVL